MGVTTALAVGGMVASGVMAANAARAGSAAQMAAAQQMRQAFADIPVPSIEEQKIILQNPDLAGQYTPEQVQAMELNLSKMEGISANQETISSQEDALKGISEVAEGGYSEADKSTAREIQRTVSQDAQARQKSILNAMAQRGVLGSGMELAAQLQGNQQATEQMSRGGENLTQQAQARALAALGQQGSLSTQMRSQQFGEKSDIAKAQDAINAFNTQNRQNVLNNNIGERNRAQMYNLQQQQALENQRAATMNQQQIHNKNLIQQRYENELRRASGMASGSANIGQASANAANADAQMIAGIGSAVGGGLMSYNAQQNSDTQAEANRKNALEIAKYK